MSVFNLKNQNENLDYKIVAGLERLSHAFKILLWNKAKEYQLSPIQIQLLIFIQHHTHEKTTISYLAQEFHLTKPTISDAIKVIEQKLLIKKVSDSVDTRSYFIQLTAAGKKIVSNSEDFTFPIENIVRSFGKSEKEIMWQSIVELIQMLNKENIIETQRTCSNCIHFAAKSDIHFCKLLNKKLQIKDIRLDCEEFSLK